MTRVLKVKNTYFTLLASVKAHLNIESSYTDDDTLITSIIEDATALAELEIDGDIADTTTTVEKYNFCGQYVYLDVTPAQSITSINYLDDNGDSQSITIADVEISYGTQQTRINLEEYYDTDKLTVVMKTGYTSLATTPKGIQRAILMKCADLYDVERGSMISGAFKDSKAFERALQPYKRITW